MINMYKPLIMMIKRALTRKHMFLNYRVAISILEDFSYEIVLKLLERGLELGLDYHPGKDFFLSELAQEIVRNEENKTYKGMFVTVGDVSFRFTINSYYYTTIIFSDFSNTSLNPLNHSINKADFIRIILSLTEDYKIMCLEAKPNNPEVKMFEQLYR